MWIKTDKLKTKGGFTLLELLVVLGILAALATILFPVFLVVRERARATACVSNLRQLYLAFSQYASDNDAYLPPYIAPDRIEISMPGQRVIWPDQSIDLIASLAPYTLCGNLVLSKRLISERFAFD
jgi:prepilin-type N-terminal cleavage/methylation domain-containing protein